MTSIENPSHPAQEARKAYSKPHLLDYGQVADLTQGGVIYFPPNPEGPFYTSIPT